MKTLTTMAAEVAELNTEKGWRTGDVSWGDHTALLHTEIAEATDSYRVRGMAEYTTSTGKPDDVASELADVLIRLLDMLDVHAVVLPFADEVPARLAYLGEMPSAPRGNAVSFGEFMARLHSAAAELGDRNSHEGRAHAARYFLAVLMDTCRNWSVDLDDEYDRKMTFNRTREFRHGGKAL